jgi:redox-sensitive bicupin YhaK (pirin superfamily)
MNLDIERIRHPEPHGRGYAEYEQIIRQTMQGGQDFRVEAGKRKEFRISPGSCAVVYVVTGNVRFEGDDTAAAEGDIVWFKPVPEGSEPGVLGVEADTPCHAVFSCAPAKGRAAAR